MRKKIHFVTDVMAIKISTIYVVLVLPVILAENGYIGYNYRAPVLTNQIPTNLRNNNIQQPYHNNVPELQHGFVPSPVYYQHYSGDSYRNQLSQTQDAFHYNNQRYQSVNYNNITPNDGNGNLIGAQNLQENIQAYPSRNPSYTNTRSQQPVIMKHIYFHLPPDDTANMAPVTPLPPKKTYNIMFIKLPSHKSASAVQLQQIINQRAAESKTLIYVLVRKPETHIVQPVTSKPEVFFVKYKEPRRVAQVVDSGLVQVPQSSIPGLLPGLVNGHGV